MTLEDKYKASPFAHLGKTTEPLNDVSIFLGKDGYARSIKEGTTTISYPDDKSVVGPWRNRLPSGGQPYLEIFPYDSSATKHLNSLSNRTLPIGSGVRDIARITQFLTSGDGILFLIGRTLLQLANPTLETKIFNPLSMYAQYARIWGTFIPGAGTYAVKGHLPNPFLGGASRYYNQDDPSDGAMQKISTEDSRIVNQATKVLNRFDVLTAADSFRKANPNRYLFPVDANLVLTTIELAKLAPQKANGERYSANIKIQDDSVSTWRMEEPATTTATSIIKTPPNPTNALFSVVSKVISVVTPYVPLAPLRAISSALTSINKAINGISVVQNKFTIDDKYLLYVNRISLDTSKLYSMLNKILDGTVDEMSPIAGMPLGKNLDITRETLQDSYTFKMFDKNTTVQGHTANVYVDSYGLIPGSVTGVELRYGDPGAIELLQTNNDKMTVTGLTGSLFDSKKGYNQQTTRSFEAVSLVSEDESIDLVKNDYIKFAFTSVSLPSNRVAIFRATLTALADTLTPTWNNDEFVGRADMAYTYKNFERSIAFKFAIAINNPNELIATYDKLNFLYGFCYPAGYVNLNIGMLSPLVKLTIGDLYKNVLGYFESFVFTVEDTSTWEIEPGYQVPKYISVDIGFKTIWSGKSAPVSSGRHLAFGNLYVPSNDSSKTTQATQPSTPASKVEPAPKTVSTTKKATPYTQDDLNPKAWRKK
jgi:hypothetical protein